MLVRFLSYAASVIGAKRYKPLLISCLALVFTITGVSLALSSAFGGNPDTASQVEQQDNKPKSGQEQTSLGGLQQKSTKKDEAIAPESQTPADSTDKRQTGTSGTAETPFELTLNTSMVSLSQTNPNSAVTVTVTGGGNVQWTLTPETAGGVNGRIETTRDGGAVVRFRADTLTSGTYQFIVTAKNADGTQSASKTITATVN